MAPKVLHRILLYAKSPRAQEAVTIPRALAGMLFRSECRPDGRNHDGKPEQCWIPLLHSSPLDRRRPGNVQATLTFAPAFHERPRIVFGVQGPCGTGRTGGRTAILRGSMRD